MVQRHPTIAVGQSQLCSSLVPLLHLHTHTQANRQMVHKRNSKEQQQSDALVELKQKGNIFYHLPCSVKSTQLLARHVVMMWPEAFVDSFPVTVEASGTGIAAS